MRQVKNRRGQGKGRTEDKVATMKPFYLTKKALKIGKSIKFTLFFSRMSFQAPEADNENFLSRFSPAIKKIGKEERRIQLKLNYTIEAIKI